MSLVARLKVRIARWTRSVGLPREWHLIPLAAVVGVLAGLVAVGFDLMVESSGAFFYGVLGAQGFAGSEYLTLLLLPAIGGLAVGIIQHFVARTPPSHGIPEVVEALARNHGVMQGRQGVFKTITASLTIGSGGSAGVEGPIIMVGSILGSVISQILRISREHVHTLVGCGAAAGMAAIFNAPIAALMFVLEVLLRDFSFKTFMPIVVAAVFGVATAQGILGENEALFNVPPAMRGYNFQFYEILPYALLGLTAGVVGVSYAGLQRNSERLAKQTPIPPFLRPAVGALLLGVLGVGFIAMHGKVVHTYEPPAFYGNGYRVIEAFLNPASYGAQAEAIASAQQHAVEGLHGVEMVEAVVAEGHDSLPAIARVTIPLLLMLLVLKMAGTIFTLAFGGSGGILAPSLFMGAVLGGLCGMLTNATGLLPTINPATYALAGMAGMLAAVAYCPLTAFLLVFEITQDYKVIVPMMLVTMLATFTAQAFNRDSIYTSWLRKLGIRFGSHADMTLLRRLEVRDVPLLTPVIVHPEEPAQRLIEMADKYSADDFVVCDDDNRYLGMVVGNDLRTTLLQREAIPLMIVQELMRTNLPTVEPDDTLDLVLDKFAEHDVANLAVLERSGQLRGTISRSRLMRQYHRLLEA